MVVFYYHIYKKERMQEDSASHILTLVVYLHHIFGVVVTEFISKHTVLFCNMRILF